MPSFEYIGDKTAYPTHSYDGQTDQSYGFTDARMLQSGTMRGTQTIAGTDGSKITLGSIANSNDFGIAFYDATGNMVGKIVAGTYYFYDPTDSYRNRIRIGSAPDDKRTGVWVSKTGNNVTSLLGG